MLQLKVGLGEKYADLSAWVAAVSVVCGVAGLPQPLLQDCFPVRGGPTVVFEVPGNAVLKYYTRETPVRFSALLHVDVFFSAWKRDHRTHRGKRDDGS